MQIRWFFLFIFYIFYGACERKDLIKNSYAYIIYELCHQIFNLSVEDFKKGIWPLIDKYNKYNSVLAKFINISRDGYDTIFGIFNAFSNEKLFCPLFTTFDSCICTIKKK